MDLDEYQDAAFRTAVYPDAGAGTDAAMAYVLLKLSGEAGEVGQKWAKYLRGDYPYDQALQVKLAKELGGVLWYVAAAAREIGFTLTEIAKLNLDELAKRAATGTLKGDGDDRGAQAMREAAKKAAVDLTPDILTKLTDPNPSLQDQLAWIKHLAGLENVRTDGDGSLTIRIVPSAPEPQDGFQAMQDAQAEPAPAAEQTEPKGEQAAPAANPEPETDKPANLFDRPEPLTDDEQTVRDNIVEMVLSSILGMARGDGASAVDIAAQTLAAVVAKCVKPKSKEMILTDLVEHVRRSEARFCDKFLAASKPAGTA